MGALILRQELPGLNEPARDAAKTTLGFVVEFGRIALIKVTGPNGVAGAAAARPGARPAAGGFSLAGADAAPDAAPAGRLTGATAVSSLDALLALQEIGGPLERRRKAVKRAGRILDILDEVKLALLDGGLPPAALDRLLSAVREERTGTDDPRLEGLLNEIETRAAVELAKLERARAAA